MCRPVPVARWKVRARWPAETPTGARQLFGVAAQGGAASQQLDRAGDQALVDRRAEAVARAVARQGELGGEGPAFGIDRLEAMDGAGGHDDGLARLDEARAGGQPQPRRPGGQPHDLVTGVIVRPEAPGRAPACDGLDAAAGGAVDRESRPHGSGTRLRSASRVVRSRSSTNGGLVRCDRPNGSPLVELVTRRR